MLLLFLEFNVFNVDFNLCKPEQTDTDTDTDTVCSICMFFSHPWHSVGREQEASDFQGALFPTTEIPSCGW